MRPQTIQIFLPNGLPRGIRIAELTNRVVKAILIPRNQLDNASKWKDWKDKNGKTLDELKRQ